MLLYAASMPRSMTSLDHVKVALNVDAAVQTLNELIAFLCHEPSTQLTATGSMMYYARPVARKMSYDWGDYCLQTQS
jgi:hypothetical protein